MWCTAPGRVFPYTPWSGALAEPSNSGLAGMHSSGGGGSSSGGGGDLAATRAQCAVAEGQDKVTTAFKEQLCYNININIT